jgi:transcriptional/translational regulatory protein YebC/TACO1
MRGMDVSETGMDRRGEKNVKEETLMAVALDAGAEDIREEDDNNYEIITAPEDFEAVKKSLADAGIPLGDAEVTMLPQSYVSLSGKEAELMLKLMDALDDSDDVQKVYTNADIADDEMPG